MNTEQAIEYLRSRKLYCLDQGSKPYTPVNGEGCPLPAIEQPTKLAEDCAYGGVPYLRRFDRLVGWL